MDETAKRVYQILEAAMNSATTAAGRQRIEEFQVYHGCVEPGYDDGIWVVGNWNDLDKYNPETRERTKTDNIPSRLGRVLEMLDGVNHHWSDMVDDCVDCGRIFLTTGDGYGWQPSYIPFDGGNVCLECADAAEHFESLEGCHDGANSVEAFDPEDHGYIKLMEFERGMHPGQDSDPRLVGGLLDKAGFKRYIFNIDSTGQFDFRFSVWLHEEEAERDDGMGQIEALRALERGKTDGPSVSEGMKRALKETSRKADQIQRNDGDAIISTIHPDGADDVRAVSQEDLFKGKALE